MIQFQDIITQKQKDLHRTMESKPLEELKDEIRSLDRGGANKRRVNNVDKKAIDNMAINMEALEGNRERKFSDRNEGFISRNMDAKTDGQNFEQSLKSTEDVRVICEYKPASPSMGNISTATIEDTLEAFESAGACAVSILTEEHYFKGSLNNLKVASNLTELPIIRKDFLIDEYQIFEAKAAGADAVLLISNIYPDIYQGVELCRSLGMEALVECKSRKDIENALKAGAHVIGVNNRDFKDFTVDLERSRKLAGYIPEDVVMVSESGVKNPKDAELLSSYGADAILVGTGIMGANGKLEMFNRAQKIVNAVKGLKTERIQKMNLINASRIE